MRPSAGANNRSSTRGDKPTPSIRGTTTPHLTPSEVRGGPLFKNQVTGQIFKLRRLLVVAWGMGRPSTWISIVLVLFSAASSCAISLPSGREILRQIRKVAPDVRMSADISGVKITSGGHGLFGRFFTPTFGIADKCVAPAVLLLHGIPGTEQNYDVAYGLRQIGINCLMFHYRGCWGSPGDYAITNLEEDIETALLWLKEQPTVDASKIIIVGHSLGGYHTLRLASHAAKIAKQNRAGGMPDYSEVSQVLCSVRGFCALCPLVATDGAGVPLSDEYSEQFASFLTNVTAKELQEQWGGLKPVSDMLEELADRDREGLDGKAEPAKAKPRKLSKAQLKEMQKAKHDKRRSDLRRGKPLLVITGDLDPLFSVEYYRKHLMAPLEKTTSFRYDWIRKREGDHALCRYRKEVVSHVLSFVCACTGHRRWTLGERVASAAENAIAYVPWMTLVGIVMGVFAGRASVWDEYDEFRRELAGLPPVGDKGQEQWGDDEEGETEKEEFAPLTLDDDWDGQISR